MAGSEGVARRRVRSLARDTSGAVLVEFALTALVFFAFAVGTIEVGRLFWIGETLQLAASRAARYASIHGANSGSPASDADVTAAAESAVAGLSTAEMTVVTTWQPDNLPGSNVTVVVRYPYSPFAARLVPIGSLTLSGTASSVVIN